MRNKGVSMSKWYTNCDNVVFISFWHERKSEREREPYSWMKKRHVLELASERIHRFSANNLPRGIWKGEFLHFALISRVTNAVVSRPGRKLKALDCVFGWFPSTNVQSSFKFHSIDYRVAFHLPDITFCSFSLPPCHSHQAILHLKVYAIARKWLRSCCRRCRCNKKKTI